MKDPLERIEETLVESGRLARSDLDRCRAARRAAAIEDWADSLAETARLSGPSRATLLGLARSAAKRSGRIVRTQPPGGLASPAAESIGGYRVLGLLGEGGMGRVYRALDPATHRVVALKVLKAGDQETAGIRLEREGRVTAGLSHPNVVAIHDAGFAGGLPFLVMEYVEGRGLDAILREEPVSHERAARLVQQAAAGLAAAHEKGILHRDVKPANLLVDGFDRLKVSDFGLAAELASEERTRTGVVLGTPYYMSPEQASGNTRSIGPASDVYSLGAVLYECLTLTRPVEGHDLSQILLAIPQGRIEPVRRRAALVPRDLEAIVMKALDLDPPRRYPDCGQMSRDLERFLGGLPVVARPLTPFSRFSRLVRRHRRTALVTGILLAASAGMAFWQIGGRIADRRAALREVALGDLALAAGHVGEARTHYLEAYRRTALEEVERHAACASVLLEIEKRLAEEGRGAIPWARGTLWSLAPGFDAGARAKERLQERLAHGRLALDLAIAGARCEIARSGSPEPPGPTPLEIGDHELAEGEYVVRLLRPAKPDWLLRITVLPLESIEIAFREVRIDPAVGDSFVRALAEARSGSILELAAGDHAAPIEAVALSRVLIEGDPSGEPPRLVRASPEIPAFRLEGASDVTLRGIRLAADRVGLSIVGCRRIVARDVEIGVEGGTGIEAARSAESGLDEIVLAGIWIDGAAVGIRVTGSAAANASRILIEDVHMRTSVRGIEAAGVERISIDRCRLEATGDEAREGVLLVDASAAAVRSSLLSGFEEGCRAEYVRGLEFTGNVFHATGYGIAADGVQALSIRGNTFSAIGDAGLRIYSALDIRVLSNRFEGGERAIDLDGVTFDPDDVGGNVLAGAKAPPRANLQSLGAAWTAEREGTPGADPDLPPPPRPAWAIPWPQ